MVLTIVIPHMMMVIMVGLAAVLVILMHLAVQVALVLQTKDTAAALVPRIPRPILAVVVVEQAQLDQPAAAVMATVVQGLIHQLLVAQLVMLEAVAVAAKVVLILQQRMVAELVTTQMEMVLLEQQIQAVAEEAHQFRAEPEALVDQALLF